MAEDFTVEELNKQLTRIYEDYDKQIKKLIFNNTEKYSRPYYCGIMPNWCDNNAIRIMVVGKEGRGFLDNYKNSTIAELQQRNLDLICNPTKGFFWNRIKNICAISKRIQICYNNSDKIHNRGTSCCVLSTDERTTLHNIKIEGYSILQKEINILKPDIVIFFGYNDRKKILIQDLPNFYQKFYEENEGDGYKKSGDGQKIYMCNEDARPIYIFTKHPNCQPKKYEISVINNIRKVIEENFI